MPESDTLYSEGRWHPPLPLFLPVINGEDLDTFSFLLLEQSREVAWRKSTKAER